MINAVISVLAPILVPLFFLGLAGSLLVVVLTSINDLGEVFVGEVDPEDNLSGPPSSSPKH